MQNVSYRRFIHVHQLFLIQVKYTNPLHSFFTVLVNSISSENQGSKGCLCSILFRDQGRMVQYQGTINSGVGQFQVLGFSLFTDSNPHSGVELRP